MSSNALPSRATSRTLTFVAIVCAIVLAGGVVVAPLRTWSNLLVGSFYLLTIGLGGAIFLALTYVSNAGWHVAFRRVPEAMARTLPLASVAILLVLGVAAQRYGWTHDHGDAGTFWFKELWLQPTFWLVRTGIYLVVWGFLSRWMIARSCRQDQAGGAAITAGNMKISALLIAVYAVTFTLASTDWIMALDPLWFSTMWGVYHFAGMIEAAIAVIVILCLVLRAPRGPLHGVFNDEHLHDLGKLLLGFSCFWMYIWFSQYMLIWYSNIPEETSYFVIRMRGPWGPVVLLSLILNWVVPFFVLLPRSSKRSGSVMMKIAVVVLIGRWIDLYTMVFPAVTHAETHQQLFAAPVFGPLEVAAIGGLAATAALWLPRSFAARNPVPTGEPYLAESLDYHAE